VGCKTTDPLTQAADDLGRANAGIHLDLQPPTCWKDIEKAKRKLGDDPVVILHLDDHQIDLANQQGRGCAAFNDNRATLLEKTNAASR